MARRNRRSLMEAAGAQPIAPTEPTPEPTAPVAPPAARVIDSPPPTKVPVPAVAPEAKQAAPQQRTRVGLKPVTTYLSKEAKRQLIMLKLDTEKDVEALLREAINLLFEKHGKNPIA